MRLHGLLSFYDEPPENLTRCVTSLSRAGVSHLVALDGAYALYPEGEAASHPNQHAALVLACRELGMGLTLHVPDTVWSGNEVQKRTALFAIAWTLANDGDWFLVMDADQVVTEAPDTLRGDLAATEHDTAEARFIDVPALAANRRDWPPEFDVRCLFRAQPITVETNHITYRAADGRLLWGWDDPDAVLEPALALPGLLIAHRPHERPAERQRRKLVYYAERDRLGVERGRCADCGQPAARLVAVDWRDSDIGPVADWREACEACARDHELAGRRQLAALGMDPDAVAVENRNGKVPA